MEYLLESGQWLTDGRLFDGAPIRLFGTMAEAGEFASQFPVESQASGVQFIVDALGKVVTRRNSEKPPGPHSRRS